MTVDNIDTAGNRIRHRSAKGPKAGYEGLVMSSRCHNARRYGGRPEDHGRGYEVGAAERVAELGQIAVEAPGLLVHPEIAQQ